MKMKNFALLMGTLFALLLSSLLFEKCNRPEPVKPSQAQQIENETRHQIDSLKQINNQLADSVQALKSKLKQQETAANVTKQKAAQTIGRLRSALQEKDTSKIIVYADDVIEDCNAFAVEAVKKDSIQNAIIEKQSAIIEASRGEIDLHEIRFDKMKSSFEETEKRLQELAKQNKRLNKKLNRSKFFNKAVLIGAIAGGTIILLR